MNYNNNHIKDVTLVAVTSVAINATIRAIKKCQDEASFGSILLLSDRFPSQIMEGVEFEMINPIKSREDYSKFIIKDLARYIRTTHALLVQWDGYILDGFRWQDKFLDYDYIGAPWPHFSDRYVVGNGGFSLRSKKLLEACRNLPLKNGEPEDVLICRHYREYLEQTHALRFAPEHLARQFAYERMEKIGTEFGFHGVFNMFRDMPSAEFSAILATLEPRLLGRQESNEIIWGALRRGHFKTLMQCWRQRF
ncbi:MAG: hypothetical protein LKF30_05175 [Sphingobium sp.]|jgi:hypothetical protein|nr:hypothetical protein [Sphingobium sp.]MCI2052825.1 hypothetical protein [Sphingobium sp.]